MRPAQPAHLERLAVIVVMGVDPDAIGFRGSADLAGLLVQLSRRERPLYRDMSRVLVRVGTSPIGLARFALEP